jgi:hypothetical protein
MGELENYPEVVVKLLRAVAAGSDAKKHGHDTILNAAADMIEQLTSQLKKALYARD